MKRFLTLSLVALACSSSLSALAGCLDDVKTAGVLRAGNGLMGMHPFVWQNTDGTYSGIEADVLKEVGKRIGVPKTDFIVSEWTTLIPGLKAGRWDVIISGMSATQERIQTANIRFSRPYFLLYDELIVKSDSPFKTAADLKGKIVATTLGTNDSLNAHRLAAEGKVGEVLDFNTFGEPFAALQNNQADAVLLDQAALLGQLEKTKNLRVVGQPIYEAPKPEWALAETKADYKFGSSAIAVRAECTDLLTALNTALLSMDKDGTRQKILARYGAWSPQQAVLTK
jgi:L-cystine transport system substrate-binding protein